MEYLSAEKGRKTTPHAKSAVEKGISTLKTALFVYFILGINLVQEDTSSPLPMLGEECIPFPRYHCHHLNRKS